MYRVRVLHITFINITRDDAEWRPRQIHAIKRHLTPIHTRNHVPPNANATTHAAHAPSANTQRKHARNHVLPNANASTHAAHARSERTQRKHARNHVLPNANIRYSMHVITRKNVSTLSRIHSFLPSNAIASLLLVRGFPCHALTFTKNDDFFGDEVHRCVLTQNVHVFLQRTQEIVGNRGKPLSNHHVI